MPQKQEYITTSQADNEKLSLNQVVMSSSVVEIISNKPGYWVRKGAGLIFIIIALLLLGTWFIKYPDVVQTKAVLNAINAPKPIVAKKQGKLTRLLANNGQQVEEGTIIGVMETTANTTEVLQLEKALNSMDSSLIHDDYKALNEVVRRLPNSNLGEIQQAFQAFMQAYISFCNYSANGVFLKKLTLLQDDLKRLSSSQKILQQQKQLTRKDLGLTQATYDANEKLVKDKVISQQEYREITSKLISKQMSLPQIESGIIANEAQHNDKQKEILELESQISVQKTIFLESLHTLKSQLADWKQQYLLIAPVSGLLHFTKPIQENQQINSNNVIAYVSPANTSYFMQALIPQGNFGKIKNGQEVLIKFPAYPWQEFGALKGRVGEIATVAADSSGYMAQIQLPNGLTTSEKKTITYREGLVADASIITKDQRLLQRFYYSIVKQTGR